MPTPLKTPVQIVDPEDRPWRTQYRRRSLRLVQLTSRRLVLRGRFRLPTDFSHSVFIPFGEPAGPWELPHGRGSVTLFPNRERFIFLPGTPRLRLSGWGSASPFGRLRERYAAPRSTFRPVPWLRNRGPSKSECWANCTNRRETVLSWERGRSTDAPAAPASGRSSEMRQSPGVPRAACPATL